jgi:hypothetical protein
MLQGVSRRPFPTLSALAALAATLAWPALAWACPACLGSDTRNAMFLKVGSLFVLLPFLVVGLVLYVLRHAPEGVTRPPAS